MKVALVHEFLNQFGGAERVLEVLHDMYPDAPVYTLMYDREKIDNHFDEWDIRPSFLQQPGIARLRKYTLPLAPLAIESFDLDEYDLVISSSNSFAKGVLTKPSTLHICYCHTPTAYLWSWYHQYVQEQHLGQVTGSIVRTILHRQRQWDRLAAERVDTWVANSKNVQERIQKYYRKESVVIYPPVDVNRFQVAAGKGEYFVYLSRLSGYKKPELVVEAFNELKLPLVVIGEGDEKTALQKNAQGNIRFAGQLSDTEVASHLERSRALIFPVDEDFGIAPVEAMAAGRPVLALKHGGAMETVIQGKTGLFFHEQSAASIVKTVRDFLRSEESFHPVTIRKHAEQFHRRHFLSRMERLIEVTLESHRKHGGQR